MNSDELIHALNLRPHPEGGYYRETFRDSQPTGERAHSTAIYFLLPQGELSRWHRIDATEIFHYYSGAPLELQIQVASDKNAPIFTRILGPDVEAGQEPQIVIPGSMWQCARSLGQYSLVGCTVSPGFEFSQFEMREMKS